MIRFCAVSRDFFYFLSFKTHCFFPKIVNTAAYQQLPGRNSLDSFREAANHQHAVCPDQLCRHFGKDRHPRQYSQNVLQAQLPDRHRTRRTDNLHELRMRYDQREIPTQEILIRQVQNGLVEFASGSGKQECTLHFHLCSLRRSVYCLWKHPQKILFSCLLPGFSP